MLNAHLFLDRCEQLAGDLRLPAVQRHPRLPQTQHRSHGAVLRAGQHPDQDAGVGQHQGRSRLSLSFTLAPVPPPPSFSSTTSSPASLRLGRLPAEPEHDPSLVPCPHPPMEQGSVLNRSCSCHAIREIHSPFPQPPTIDFVSTRHRQARPERGQTCSDSHIYQAF